MNTHYTAKRMKRTADLKPGESKLKYIGDRLPSIRNHTFTLHSFSHGGRRANLQRHNGQLVMWIDFEDLIAVARG